jgi:hypothetical protein
VTAAASGGGTGAELHVLPGTPAPAAPPGASGRVRHDEKITVYVSADELHALELARLELARRHGVRVDRGRMVREAVAHLVADFEVRGPRSVLVTRLRGR